MNTKIIAALVIGIALFGLTGAASATETWDEITYVHKETLESVQYLPTDEFLVSGAFFYKIIDDFDGSYGYTAGEHDVMFAGGVVNIMDVDVTGVGAYNSEKMQTGKANVTLRSLDKNDGVPEIEMYVGKAQKVDVEGSLDMVVVDLDGFGLVGEYGAVSNGLPGCGSLCLCEQVQGDVIVAPTGMIPNFGATQNAPPTGAVKIDSVGVSLSSHQGLTADLEGVPPANPKVDVYGGVSMGVSYDGFVMPINDYGMPTPAGIDISGSFSEHSGYLTGTDCEIPEVIFDDACFPGLPIEDLPWG